MSGDIKDIDRAFHVVSVLDGTENFYSGHDTDEAAKSRCTQANDRATELGIRTRYQVKENKKNV